MSCRSAHSRGLLPTGQQAKARRTSRSVSGKAHTPKKQSQCVKRPTKQTDGLIFMDTQRSSAAYRRRRLATERINEPSDCNCSVSLCFNLILSMETSRFTIWFSHISNLNAACTFSLSTRGQTFCLLLPPGRLCVHPRWFRL